MLNIDNAEVRCLFKPGREIDVFASEDGLIEKIEYYLPRATLRCDMIERAYRRCVPAYGYDARAEVISRRMMALLESRAGNSSIAHERTRGLTLSFKDGETGDAPRRYATGARECLSS